MSDWFTKAFGVAIGDARAKLIDEGWFGRIVPETRHQSDLGWSRDERPEPSPFDSPDQPHDHDRGIDL